MENLNNIVQKNFLLMSKNDLITFYLNNGYHFQGKIISSDLYSFVIKPYDENGKEILKTFLVYKSSLVNMSINRELNFSDFNNNNNNNNNNFQKEKNNNNKQKTKPVEIKKIISTIKPKDIVIENNIPFNKIKEKNKEILNKSDNKFDNKFDITDNKEENISINTDSSPMDILKILKDD